MIKNLKLNINKTYELYLESKDLIEKGHCYNNCINILANLLLEDYHKGEYKIGYCYTGGQDHYLVRHCVIINKKNEVIDVTALSKYEVKELRRLSKLYNIQYYIFAELDSQQLYFALEKANYVPALKNIFSEKEKELYEYISKLGLEINSCDYNMFIKELL
jgi:hypothetical protein